jgi:chromosome partitioning protein
MAKIIGVIQVKGGAGRSTVSTNLAGELAKKGKTVLIDCDMPQGTAASWYAVREQQGKTQDLLAGFQADTASSHQELVAKTEQHAGSDFIVLDGPPRLAELTRAILMLADANIVPVGASTAEIWATSDLVELVKEAKAIRPIVARMLWTRYRANTKLAQELAELASKALGLAAMETVLGMRVAYMTALGEGLTVAETADRAAKAECISLVEETLKLTKRKR